MTAKPPAAESVERCDLCGFEYLTTAGELSGALTGLGGRFGALLIGAVDEPGGDALLRRRPDPEVWSALGYACHVRDVVLAQRERLYLMLVEDDPTFSPMYREERVILAGYDDEDPRRLASELAFVTEMLGRAFSRLTDEQWQRRCRYNFPVPADRTLLWVGQQTLHEGEHHLADAERVLAVNRSSQA